MRRNFHRHTNEKKNTINPLFIVRIAVGVLLVLFAIGIWFYHHPFRPVSPSQQPSETSGSGEIIKPTSLPSELMDPNSLSVLVNDNHPLSFDYVPSDLINTLGSVAGDAILISQRMDEDLANLLTDAAYDEIALYITAGYISYETQQDYYNAQVKLVGEKEALKTVSKPGCSEHQTGYSIDFSDNNSGENPRTMDFANTDAYRWLCEHAHEYGFILRYPAGKEEITSNSYEPWHFRYVGIDTATAMYEQAPDLTLEEYYNVR